MIFEDVFVSVILPTYNTDENYLRSAIESILNQSHTNFEFIITNDGSNSNDLNIIKEYACKDKRIIVVDNETNKGLVYSLNNMISMSRGKYIFRMDSDDISYNNRLEILISFMENNKDIDICGSQIRYLFENKKSRQSFLPCTDHEIKSWMIFSNPIAHPSVVFRHSSIRKFNINYSYEEKSEDYNLWVDCAAKGIKFANINKPLLLYRLHNNQTISKYKSELNDSGIRVRNKYLNFLNLQIDNSDLFLISQFAQDPTSLSDSELIKISEIMVCSGLKFDYVSEAYKTFANMFMRKILVIRKKRRISLCFQKQSNNIMKYGTKFNRFLYRLCVI